MRRQFGRAVVVEPLEARALFSAGDFNPLFGDAIDGVIVTPGEVRTALTTGRKDDNRYFTDAPSAVVVQPDGAILVAGMASRYNRRASEDTDRAVVVRYLPNGSLDTTFGGGDGILEPAFTVGTPSTLSDVLLTPEGDIVVVGRVVRGSQGVKGLNHDVVVARFKSDGSTDPTFGDLNGAKFIDLGSNGDSSGPALLLPDGAVVVTAAVAPQRRARLVLLRVNPQGQPDATFGDGDPGNPGLLKLPSMSRSGDEAPTAIRADALGRIVVVGISGAAGKDPAERGNFFAARFQATGAPDTTFGASTSAGGRTGYIVLPQIDGKLQDRPLDLTFETEAGDPTVQSITVAGSSQTARRDFHLALAHLSSDGTLLGAPTSVPAPANARIQAAAFDSQGRVVTAGVSQRDAGKAPRDFALSRFTPDGALDTSFAEGGSHLLKVPRLTSYADVELANGTITVAGNLSSDTLVSGSLRVFHILSFENDVTD